MSASRSTRTSVKVLTRERWLDALFAPRTRCALVVCNHFARRRTPWNNVHPDLGNHMLVYCERGAYHMEVEGRDLRVESGGLLWVPPGLRRRAHGDPERQPVRHINLRFTLERGASALAAADAPLLLTRADPVRGALVDLLAYRDEPGPCPQHRLRALLGTLATACFALDEAGSGEPGLMPHQRHRLRRLLAERLHEPLAPADLAAAAGLSLDYFTRRFRRSFGVPPRRYLVEERMRVAAERLADSEDSVVEIAREVGLADANLFVRQFRGVHGRSPGAFRRLSRQARAL
jgi:AraC-like DNA-binding protein